MCWAGNTVKVVASSPITTKKQKYEHIEEETILVYLSWNNYYCNLNLVSLNVLIVGKHFRISNCTLTTFVFHACWIFSKHLHKLLQCFFLSEHFSHWLYVSLPDLRLTDIRCHAFPAHLSCMDTCIASIFNQSYLFTFMKFFSSVPTH